MIVYTRLCFANDQLLMSSSWLVSSIIIINHLIWFPAPQMTGALLQITAWLILADFWSLNRAWSQYQEAECPWDLLLAAPGGLSGIQDLRSPVECLFSILLSFHLSDWNQRSPRSETYLHLKVHHMGLLLFASQSLSSQPYIDQSFLLLGNLRKYNQFSKLW